MRKRIFFCINKREDDTRTIQAVADELDFEMGRWANAYVPEMLADRRERERESEIEIMRGLKQREEEQFKGYPAHVVMSHTLMSPVVKRNSVEEVRYELNAIENVAV